MKDFRNVYLANSIDLLNQCKSFAADLVGTKYEFLLDTINPAIFDPSDIEITQARRYYENTRR